MLPPRGFRVQGYAAAVVALSLGLLAAFALPSFASADVEPTTVQVSKSRGVLKVANLRVGPDSWWSRRNPPPTMSDAISKFGPPRSVRRPYRTTCDAYYERGLILTFTSFGLESNCRSRSLQAATVGSRAWRVRVGKRTYRVGTPKRRIPAKAKRVPYYGYQLASKRFYGRSTGIAFARIGSEGRIASFYFFIGGAGD